MLSMVLTSWGHWWGLYRKYLLQSTRNLSLHLSAFIFYYFVEYHAYLWEFISSRLAYDLTFLEKKIYSLIWFCSSMFQADAVVSKFMMAILIIDAHLLTWKGPDMVWSQYVARISMDFSSLHTTWSVQFVLVGCFLTVSKQNRFLYFQEFCQLKELYCSWLWAKTNVSDKWLWTNDL